MLADMLEFCFQLLEGVAVWLGSEPMIYLFGVVLICFVFKAFRGFFE